MNKLLTRIAILAAGAGLAVAVGVASSKGSAKVAKAAEATDVLTYQLYTDTSSSSYSDWSNKTLVDGSGAVYAGNSASDKNSIQLRSNNNNSGVVVTESVGKVKSISFVFHADTAAARTVDVYARNTAYTSATELYGEDKGEKVYTAAMANETNSYTFEGDYEYFGFRSTSGALYLTSVTVVWEVVEKSPLASIAVTTQPAKVAYVEEEVFNKAGMVVTATYEDGSTKDVTNSVTLSGDGEPLAVGTDNVTITYIERGVTKIITLPITVSVNANKHVYKAVSAPEAGSFVIAYTLVSETEGTATYAALPELTNGKLNYRKVSVDAEGNVVTGNAAYVWTVAAVTVGEATYYTIYNANQEKYLSSGQNDSNAIALADAIDEEKKTEYWNIENKTVTTAAGDVTQLVIEAPFKTYIKDGETKLSDARYVSYNPGYGFACYKANSSAAKLVNLCKDNGVAPSSDPEPTPTPEPEPEKKGCRGEIVTTSIILSTLALAGVTLLGLKKKRD